MQLLAEPNVLLLDEPTNDLDTDMLTALEDLLDSWPGTLVVVSHDRYLVERVTDQQYALLDGTLRHLPRGIDEYLGLFANSPRSATPASTPVAAPNSTQLVVGSKEHRAAEKELSSTERQLAKAQAELERIDAEMADIDPSDWQTLQQMGSTRDEVTATIERLEARWLELTEMLEAAS